MFLSLQNLAAGSIFSGMAGYSQPDCYNAWRAGRAERKSKSKSIEGFVWYKEVSTNSNSFLTKLFIFKKENMLLLTYFEGKTHFLNCSFDLLAKLDLRSTKFDVCTKLYFQLNWFRHRPWQVFASAPKEESIPLLGLFMLQNRYHLQLV